MPDICTGPSGKCWAVISVRYMGHTHRASHDWLSCSWVSAPTADELHRGGRNEVSLQRQCHSPSTSSLKGSVSPPMNHIHSQRKVFSWSVQTPSSVILALSVAQCAVVTLKCFLHTKHALKDTPNVSFYNPSIVNH